MALTQKEKDELLRRHGTAAMKEELGPEEEEVTEDVQFKAAFSPRREEVEVTETVELSEEDQAWEKFLADRAEDRPEEGTLNLAQLSKDISGQEESKGFFASAWEDIKERGGNIKDIFMEESMGDEEDDGLIKEFAEDVRTGGHILGQIAGGVGDIIGQGLFHGAKVILPKAAEEKIGELGEDFLASDLGQGMLGALGTGMESYEGWKENNPELAKDVESVINVASLVPIVKGAKVGGEVVEAGVKKGAKLAKEGVETTLETAKKVTEKTKSIFKKEVKDVDDLLAQADDAIEVSIKEGSPRALREAAEATAPKISIKEKFVGVRPDIKKRIQGKQEALKDYFDIAHARNLDDTLPTPLEYAARNVMEVRDGITSTLKDTGSEIGTFRKKISTFKATPDDIKTITSTFDDELGKMNLSVVEGKIIPVKGKIQSISKSEVAALQDLRDSVKIASQSPSVENLIDLRNAFDSKINFGKQRGDVSGVVDPLSRTVRTKIADINANIVGKDQAGNLANYSQLKGLLEDLNKVVDSQSGAEFMLKKVLSERGRIPRELMELIKEITGVDLMDDATMAQLAIELIGNEAQKGVFRQEVARAGLDAIDVLEIMKGGGVRGLLKVAPKVAEKIVDTEKVFLEAAK